MRRALPFTALLAAVVLTAGCASTPAAPAATDPAPPAAEELTGEVTVFAAASLTASFDDLAAAFTAEHPAVQIVPSYDGSSTLATQIIEGAPVDVFASADEANMQKVVDAGLAADPQLFATNTLTIVVPAGNPAGITGIEDFADESLTIVLCAPEVPCGAASEKVFAAAGVTASVDSFEQNVTAVLTKVATGEADAGLVYVTDAAIGAGDVDTVKTTGADAVVNRYPLVVLDSAPNADAAAAFAEFVVGEAGQTVLAEYGFGAP
ncbi:molybdate ABC transporter substrate-binding protein [Microbacterium invictum]|uniref:Molybdate transport system substrate-binding protein n=1 Tax=Microbacterium invictum TaxID=515415 RepID=A0AA40SLE3_9MICO|nr:MULTISPECIES: molybdate ABC transporter substrate-binding protein [Microbacterium]MBB4138373.1 molybdate transport system substrate-binding protein [Microbacterium invictum]